jgi:hypothetical protein
MIFARFSTGQIVSRCACIAALVAVFFGFAVSRFLGLYESDYRTVKLFGISWLYLFVVLALEALTSQCASLVRVAGTALYVSEAVPNAAWAAIRVLVVGCGIFGIYGVVWFADWRPAILPIVAVIVELFVVVRAKSAAFKKAISFDSVSEVRIVVVKGKDRLQLTLERELRLLPEIREAASLLREIKSRIRSGN